MADDTKPIWLPYTAQGSLFCGLIAAFLTFAFMIHLDFSAGAPDDRWTGLYFLVAAPISLLGVILGVVGKDPPRKLGLILSGCVLLWVLGGVITW